MRRIITLALLVAVLPGPGCDDATERLERTAERLERAGERAQELATDFILPPEHEETLGDQLAREIAAESRLISDGPVVRYVDQLGRELLRAAAGRPEAIDFDFHVVRDDAINAFAIPGGHIYVTTGLLKAAESEAELVAVLAHEIAHVTERHVAERMTAASA